MAYRVTIMIDEELDKKLRYKQSKIIAKTNSSYSYSRAINAELRRNLK